MITEREEKFIIAFATFLTGLVFFHIANGFTFIIGV